MIDKVYSYVELDWDLQSIAKMQQSLENLTH